MIKPLITTRETTVDEALAITKANIHNALLEERYNNIISFILNNTKLNYDKTKLTIDYGELVLEYIRAVEPEYYKQKYNELTQEQQGE